MHEYEFKVGITCPACVPTVKKALLNCKDQITQGNMHVAIKGTLATVSLRQAKLRDDEIREILREAVEDAGYECLDHLAPLKPQYHRLKGIAGIVSGAALMGLCLSGIGIPMAVMAVLGILSTGLTLYLGKEVFYKAARDIKNVFTRRESSLSMDVLLAVSSVIALAISICSIFVPWVPMMFDAALLILGFSHLGKALKKSENDKADKRLNFSTQINPSVEVIKPDGNQHMKVAELKSGMTIRVYAGQTIPLDGKCISESAAVCKIIDTGKNSACSVKKGDALEAGWQVPQGVPFIDISVSKEVSQSTLAQLNKKYRLARMEKIEKRKKPPFERLADMMTNYFVPSILGIALVTAVVIGALFSPLSALQSLASMVASACPCTLGLIIPLALKTAIAKSAADGMRVKTEEGFQFLSEVDTVIFDWNGTLTTGEPHVVQTNLNPEQLAYLAALEGRSNHHVAAAICAFVKNKKSGQKSFVVSALESHHSGLMANIVQAEVKEEDQTYLAGNKQFMADHQIDVSAYENQQQTADLKRQFQAQSLTYFARAKPEGGYEILGHVLLRDPIRPDAAQVIRKLKAQGIRVGIWSGSDDETLTNFAKQNQVDYFQPNCLGTSKAGQVSQQKTKQDLMIELARQGRKTVMVGDSANDVFAMMESDFAIAVQSKNAHSMAEQSADAILDPEACKDPSKPLHPILNTITLAKQTVKSIKVNLALNLIYNFLSSSLFTILIFAAGIALNPAVGAGLMVLQSALLFWNLKRMVNQKPKYANDPLIAPSQENIYQFRPAPSLSPSKQPKAGNEYKSNHSPRLYNPDVTSTPSTTVNPSQPIKTGAQPW